MILFPVACMLLPISIAIKSSASIWEDNGFVLYYKTLAEEKFKWPKGEMETVSLTGQQLNWLLDGFDLNAMKGHKKLHFESLF